MRKVVLFTLCALFVSSASAAKRAKNVILFIADAGGVATVNAASIYGYNAPQKLFIQSWPNVALSDTSPVGRWVSDSAAGMTAIVTGTKTLNGVISQGPDAVRGKQEGTILKTILEHAEEHGLSTGVMSNVTITDATPGACYGHASDRAMWGEIFLQLFEPRFGNGVDVLYGPGRKAIWERVAKLGKDPEAVAKEKNRALYASLEDVPAGEQRPLVVVDGAVDLNRGAKTAIQLLSKNKKGFFLMIESDAHTDNPERGLQRLVDFDKLIREISGMVNLNETLLLFTADHSFDFRIAGNGGPKSPLLNGLDEWRKNTGGKGPIRLSAIRVENSHTGEEVAVAATGPGAERVRGYLPNTALFTIMLEAFGWKP
jgi:alkaline phosphatase